MISIDHFDTFKIFLKKILGVSHHPINWNYEIINDYNDMGLWK